MAAAAPLYQFCCLGQLWLQGFSQILHLNVVYMCQAGETARWACFCALSLTFGKRNMLSFFLTAGEFLFYFSLPEPHRGPVSEWALCWAPVSLCVETAAAVMRITVLPPGLKSPAFSLRPLDSPFPWLMPTTQDARLLSSFMSVMTLMADLFLAIALI